jgi:predicted dehydrogenase
LACVAVPHDQAAGIVEHLLRAGIHTLVEKPMGLDLAQAQRLAHLADESAARLAVGFNYRHYPAVVRVRQLLDEGSIGRLLFVRMILGHGARPGYEREWKLKSLSAGGGVLLDPGIHLIDLARFFLGELTAVQSRCRRLFWPSDVEDLAVALLDSDGGAQALIQTSLIEWQNRLNIDLFGEAGYLRIEGRMGNYGPQRLTAGHKWAWLGHGNQTAGDRTETYGKEDTSYMTELRAVVGAFRSGGPLPADHRDGLAAMKLVGDLYRLADQSSV